MGQLELNEQVDVITKFSKGVISPLFFKYNGRNYKVESIDLRYHFRKSGVLFHSFSIGSDGNSYKLAYNSQDSIWRLEEIFTN